MKIIEGDLFSYHLNPAYHQGTWIAIPINWTLNSQGLAVMGAGVAKRADDLFSLRRYFGEEISKTQETRLIFDHQSGVMGFPTKYNWRHPSHLKLIERSAEELRNFLVINPQAKVYLPKVGCGLGGLFWKDVEPVLDKALGDLNNEIFVVDRI